MKHKATNDRNNAGAVVRASATETNTERRRQAMLSPDGMGLIREHDRRLLQDRLRAVMQTAVALMVLAVAAMADPITLQANTTATFTGVDSVVTTTSGTVQVTTATIGASKLRFESQLPQISVALNPGEASNITLGVLRVESSGLTSLSGVRLSVNVLFTVPDGNSSQAFTGNLTGTVNTTASGAEIQWGSPLTLSFASSNGAVWKVTIEPTTAINPPSIDGSNTPSQIRARIAVTQGPAGEVPEPATLLLLGSGIVAIGRQIRRRGAK